MTKIRNRTILITGGASGIGRMIAERCGEEKAYKIILWDIDRDQLNETKTDLEAKNFVVETDVVDISSEEEIKAAAARVLNNIGPVDIVFNNAGIVVGKSFVEHSHSDIAKTISINVAGVMHVTKAFLPNMIEQEEGHIVNLASASGLLPNPNMSVYAGSKWAVVGWSESLRLELEAMEGDLHVTTVMPGYIDTGMFEGVKAPLLTPMLDPEFIVDRIIKAVKRNEIVLQEPFMVKTIPALRGLLPTRIFDFVAEKFGVYNSMDHFVGRPKNKKTPKS